jgi:hypothetical protein
MARKKKTIGNDSHLPQSGDLNLLTVSENGKAPESAIKDSNSAYQIATRLRQDNAGRANKMIRLYKAYKRFPTVEYSKIVRTKFPWQSTVNWGQLEFIIDNQKTSFIDLLTERTSACSITTKFGGIEKRAEYSELISKGFDLILRQWDGYLINREQDIEQMLLYGKGVEMWDRPTGWQSKHKCLTKIYIPSRTEIDLSNLDIMVTEDSYSPVEFYRMIQNEETAEAAGWNYWACIRAIRHNTSYDNAHRNSVQFVKDVAEGNINLTREYSKSIDVYTIYVREYGSGKISKFIVLQDYYPIASLARSSPENEATTMGFLFKKIEWFDGWKSLMCPFTDSSGSGMWHEIKGLGDRAFVGARQYDVTMNSIIDAIRLNQMLMLKGSNSESTKKLKQMEWLPISVLPEDVDFAQNRFEIPTQESLNVLQQGQNDLYSGIGQYRINAPTRQNRQRTARETEIDAAESAKLSGSQIRLYNECETRWQRETVRRFLNSKTGEQGREFYDRFVDMMTEYGVPPEAYQWENIEMIQSNMLFGAGSPSQKLMAAEKTMAICGMVPANKGQFNAMRDAIAALNTRAMVDRYLPEQKNPIPEEYNIISFENAGMNDPLANLENFRVLPTQNHLDHIRGHFSDIMTQIQKAAQAIQQGGMSKEDAMRVLVSSNIKAAHTTAHIEFVARDQSKQAELRLIMQNMAELQRMMAQLQAMIEQMPDPQQQQQQGMSEEEIKLQAKAAMAALDVETKRQLAEIKMAAIAAQHDLRQKITEEKGVTQLALQRAKAQMDAPREKPMPKQTDEDNEQ